MTGEPPEPLNTTGEPPEPLSTTGEPPEPLSTVGDIVYIPHLAHNDERY